MQTNQDYPPIFERVNFLLSHLPKPDFPRTIATKLTEDKQRIVTSIEQAIEYYGNSNYLDCRLSAYPYTVNNRAQIITFVMLDFDSNNFKYSKTKLDQALNKNLIFLNNLHVKPSVIFTGNGYHVLIPIEPMMHTLENIQEFANFTEPSKKILRYLEKYLSKSKSDIVHNSTVSFGNCMLRVPGSFNSKYGNNGQVKVTKEWNGQRLNIKPLMGDFLAYLLDERNKRRKEWFFHDLSYIEQTTDGNGHYKDIIKDYGCGKVQEKGPTGCWCVPECRFYPELL
jgi:hypothetical protein